MGIYSNGSKRIHPWPAEIDVFYPYLNLYEWSEKYWNGLLLQRSIPSTFYNIANVKAAGWLAAWDLNITEMDRIYFESFYQSGRDMFVCNPTLIGNYKKYPTRMYCYNYTPNAFDGYYRQDEIGYVYNREKPTVDILIAFATILFVTGGFGEYIDSA